MKAMSFHVGVDVITGFLPSHLIEINCHELFSCMQAMQFASPKGLLNFFMGGNSSVFARNEGKKSRCRRVFTGSLLQTN